MRLTPLIGLLALAGSCQLPASVPDGALPDAPVPPDAAVPDSAGADAPADAPAPDLTRPTVRVLFIGNSYTAVNNLPAVVAKLSQAASSPVRVEVGQHTPGGARWEDHDADPTVSQLIQKGWDYVVLQDQSQQPWTVATVKPALRSLDKKIKAAGAKTLLFMTWARAPSVGAWQVFWMHMAVSRYYEGHAAEVGAQVVPVGRAWERALRTPGLVLHAPDGSHPTAAGTYLAACSFYIALTGKSPLGLGAGGLALDAAQTKLLQQVAWDTHQARAPPAAPLVGRWPLDAKAAPSDLVPSAGLQLGGASGPGAGKATQFGSGQYAAAPWRPGLKLGSAMTLAVWAHRADWSQPLVEGLVGKWMSYELRQDQGTLEAALHTTASASPTTLSSPPLSVLSSGWHHLALTYDGATATLWIDAVPAASAQTSGALRYVPVPPPVQLEAFNGIALGGVPVSSAAAIGETQDRFTGRLADVRLYDRALSQIELQALASP